MSTKVNAKISKLYQVKFDIPPQMDDSSNKFIICLMSSSDVNHWFNNINYSISVSGDIDIKFCIADLLGGVDEEIVDVD